MPSDRQPRVRSNAGWFRSEGARALVAFVVVVSLFGLIGFIGVRPAAPNPDRPLHSGHQDDDLSTGSILFVPVLGNSCRKRLIDNATWLIRDHGVVDCSTALSQHTRARPLTWSAARVDVIRDGFRKK